ncbi:MAG TPA: CoA-binding protein [Acidimicrobiales bacterium]|jgi:acetyltransferase|nr:CoA-binding protein [Acidimicrobiales bacterium]
MTVDLKYLFEPKGVIVTGVSSHPGKFGSVALHNILSCGYEGKVFAFGREEATVLEQKVITSFDSIPSNEVDLMILCTPVGVNEELVRRASEKGIKAIFCAAGGYSETGEEGLKAEKRLVALAAELDLVLAGPNGQGIVSPPASLCAQIVAPYAPKGRIAVVSQSGNFVSSFLNYANQTGIGISRSVSAGNAAAIEIVDFLEWFATDPATDVALCYLEGLEKGRDFFERVKEITKKMPVVLVKGGTTTGGQRAAASHTGSLASDSKIFEGMARQAGITRAPNIESAFEIAATFATQPLPDGPRVLVLTTAGGWGVVTADAISQSSDLVLTPLPRDLEETINELLPPRWSKNNPIDLAGGETRDTIPELLSTASKHPEIDSIIQLGLGIQGNTANLVKNGKFYPEHGLERIVNFHEHQEKRYAEASVEASLASGKPILVASELATTQPNNPMVRNIRDLNRLCYASADRAVSALNHLVRYSSWRNQSN